ncbi:anti-phage dCTP deaminase [Vibrio anguillarum]|uniref:Deoxycytidylate deaminase n=2 Tax=Vibrio anguillarum TaxID=55601 RepID=A0AAW4BK70_VIBAN|nr:anti-phage dCTP deaminase [Vibrio anguillarum]MBF4374960.1 deoxycytidylate deaminase [Vibrio anguillarum]MBF4436741.1 deoxycytidylate deaminase [Vibrio anguillarum]
MSKSSSARKLESVPNTSNSDNSNTDIQDTIQERRSRELIIGLCGAIGSGVKALKENLIHQLESSGYKTVHIRISNIIAERTDPTLKDLTGYERYEKLQNNGDLLREKYKNSILAACAIEEIALARSEVCENTPSSEEDDDSVLKTKEKIAYIIDQLKHPDEVKLLRSVYPRNFYLIGLIRTETERRLNLEEEKIKDVQIDELIRRDRKSVKNGQQVEKTLHNADYFIHNVHNHSQLLEKSVDRFIKLVHDVNGMTPTIDEIGMHSAYSASLRSACLSRQVGAAISDEVGNIIATGCNDVPSFGGGLYNSSSTKDFRCVHRGQCSNDKHKALLKEEIKEILTQKISNGNIVKELVENITSNTKIDSLIEYSRAVHAEMDAIVSLARSIRQSSVGMTLYSTTYPCHNCARHIVAAGILRVVYIEPYEKSLALKLHDDALTDANGTHKVVLVPFEGVSPRRFEAFFRQNTKRKNDEGRVIRVRIHDSYHADSEFIDNYPEMEAKVAESVHKTFCAPEEAH